MNKDEEYKNKFEELLKQFYLKEEEIKNKDKIMLEEKEKNTNLKEKIINLEKEIELQKGKTLELEKEKKNEKLNNNQKKNNWNKLLSISEKINLNLISSISGSKVKDDEIIKNKNYLLKEEKNTFITISRVSETNSSTNNPNKNESLKNMNNSNNINSNKNINEIIINNYLNTINLGYDGMNNNAQSENLEVEPTPSFVLCLKKINNTQFYLINFNVNMYNI